MLDKFIKTIYLILGELGSNASFFIAGGSVYSLLNENREFNDVDVYFYDECYSENVHKLIRKNKKFGHLAYITNNAATIRIEDLQLEFQFIKRQYGDPWSVFNTFDLNASKCAYTSRRKVIYDPLYNINIEVDLNNFNYATLNRYHKYIKEKKGVDVGQKQLYKILDHIIEHRDEEILFGYSPDKVPILNALNIYLMDHLRNKIIHQYVHDKSISSITDEQERLDFFEKLYSLYIDDEVACDEYVLFKTIKKSNSTNIPTLNIGTNDELTASANEIQFTKREKEIMLKYPEFFI